MLARFETQHGDAWDDTIDRWIESVPFGPLSVQVYEEQSGQDNKLAWRCEFTQAGETTKVMEALKEWLTETFAPTTQAAEKRCQIKLFPGPDYRGSSGQKCYSRRFTFYAQPVESPTITAPGTKTKAAGTGNASPTVVDVGHITEQALAGANAILTSIGHGWEQLRRVQRAMIDDHLHQVARWKELQHSEHTQELEALKILRDMQRDDDDRKEAATLEAKSARNKAVVNGVVRVLAPILESKPELAEKAIDYVGPHVGDVLKMFGDEEDED